jgi:choline dehydrogenase-like flavoprotein
VDSFDLICVGSGFASHFFLKKWLELAPKNQRVLMLERGPRLTHQEHRAGKGPNSGATFVSRAKGGKQWAFSTAYGGSSNCWVGNTPRLLPNDFRTKSVYGHGQDWPLGYDDLEPHYAEAERVMAVAGPERSPFQRSGPYPLKAHRMNAFDRQLLQAWPEHMYSLPCARPSAPLENRPRCCASSFCRSCPIDSKFTIVNSMQAVTQDPRVTLVADHEVLSLDVEGGRATGVRGVASGKPFRYKGDLIVLGANAIFNAAILLRTNPDGPKETGLGITEQVSVKVTVLTKGLENFDGSTYQTGHGYMFYDGEHRKERAGALIETHNRPELRNLKDRWRDIAQFKLIYEDYRRPENRVTVKGDERPTVTYEGPSKIAQAGLSASQKLAEQLVANVPIDKLHVGAVQSTESHIMCSVPMGSDPETSVVDRTLRHHQYTNVVVAGASAFPSAPPANPTLTLSALSLWSATQILK